MPRPSFRILTWDPQGRLLLADRAWVPEHRFYAVTYQTSVPAQALAVLAAAVQEARPECEVSAIRVQPEELGGFLNSHALAQLGGMLVESGLQEEAARWCDGMTTGARGLGVVDAIRREGSGWTGHNTHSGAVLSVLVQARNEPEPPTRVSVIGSGVCARTALHGLALWGVGEVTVYAERADRFERLREWFAGADFEPRSSRFRLRSGTDAAGGTRPEVCVVCAADDALIAAGMSGAAGKRAALCLDLRGFGRAGWDTAPSGWRIINYEPVLLMRCGFALAWWLGPPVPWQAMRRILTS